MVQLAQILIVNKGQKMLRHTLIARLTPMRRTLALIASLMLLAFSPFAASAQTVKVIAVVNGEAITSLDLEHRLAYLLNSTGLEITDANEKQLRDDVLQMLVDDKLRMMEARRLVPTILEAGRTQAREMVNDTYKSDTKSAGENIRDLGLNRQIIEEKTAADIIWATLLRDRYKSQFDTADKLAEQALERAKRDLSQPQVRLSEIVLAPTGERNTAANLEIARQMIEAMEQGADFAAIARQYSASGSAQAGGNLGWIVLNTLPDTFASAIDKAPSGAILAPINQDGIIYILRKDGVRAKGFIDPSQARVDIARALLPLPADTSSSDQLIAAGELQKRAESAQNCDDIEALNLALGSGQPPYLFDLEIGSITPNLRTIIEKLELNTPSEPLNFAEGMVVFMVCKRTMPKVDLPSLDDLKNTELNKIFAIISNRYLLRLRRAATIDIRP